MQNKIKNNNTPLYKDSQFIPSNHNYISIKSPKDNQIIVLQYKDKMTFKQLEHQLEGRQVDIFSSAVKKKLIKQNGDKINYGQSIEQYKAKSLIKVFDEEAFFLGEQPFSKISKNQSKHQIMNESSIHHTNYSVKQQSMEKYGVCCIMKSNPNQIFHVYFRASPNISIKAKILTQLNNLYNTQLLLSQIQVRGLTIELQHHQDKLQFKYNSFKIQNLQDYVFKSKNLIYLQIKTLTPKFTFNNLLDQSGQIILLQQSNCIKIINQDDSYVILDYQMIKKFQVKYVLGILNIPNAENKGLKILNRVILPNQQIYNIGFAFNIFTCVNYLQALVVQQFQTFYYELNQNPALKPQQLQRLVIEDTLFNRISSSKNGASTKNYTLTPLLIYNSSFQLQLNKNHQIFYEVVKRFIKNYYTHYSNYTQNSIISRFVLSLYHQVNLLEEYKGLVYRKVYYSIKCKKDQILQFKNFIFCSKNKQTAYAIQQQGKNMTFVTIISYSGRQVGKNTIHSDLQQVVFLPYSKFKVINIQNKNNGTTFIQLQQIAIPIKKNQQNIIIWLNASQKFKTDIQIIKPFKQSNKSILFKQFGNNSAYKQWVNVNINYLKDKFYKKIVITNMRRLQNKVMNDLAGVETIMFTRKIIPEANIIAYIGHVEGTKANLKQNKIDPESLLVTAKTSQLLINLLLIMGLKQQFKKFQQSYLKNKQLLQQKIQNKQTKSAEKVIEEQKKPVKHNDKIQKQHYKDFFSHIQDIQLTIKAKEEIITSIIENTPDINEMNEEIKLISINESLVKKPLPEMDYGVKLHPSFIKAPSHINNFSQNINNTQSKQQEYFKELNISNIKPSKIDKNNQKTESSDLICIPSQFQLKSKLANIKQQNPVVKQSSLTFAMKGSIHNSKHEDNKTSSVAKKNQHQSVIFLDDEEQII